MMEGIKNLITKRTLIILFLSILAIILIVYSLGVGRNKTDIPAPDIRTTENDEQLNDNPESDEFMQGEEEDAPEQKASKDAENDEYESGADNNNSSGNKFNEGDESNNTDVKTSSNPGQKASSKSLNPQTDKDTSPGNLKPQVNKIKDSQGKGEEVIYELKINAFTKDGKPYSKTYTSSNPNETVKYYEYETINDTIKTYEVTVTMTGETVSRKLVEEEKIKTPGKQNQDSTATTGNDTEKTYTLFVDGYTRDGKPLFKVFESKNPDEVVTYYQIEGDRLYEIKKNMRGEELSKKQIKVDYTYKERIIDEIVEKYSKLHVNDGTLPIGQEVVAQEGIDGITQLVLVEKYLFDQVVGTEVKEVVKRKKQDMIIKVGTRNPMGNSGKVFKSVGEAKEWAEKEVKKPDGKWYKRSYVIYPLDHTEKEYTVNFI